MDLTFLCVFVVWHQSEEERMNMEWRMREAEVVATKVVDEFERRYFLLTPRVPMSVCV